MATPIIPPKFRFYRSARPPIWRMGAAIATKTSALLAGLAILLLPVVSCGGCPPTPGISSISPNTATAGGAGFVITVNGDSFRSNSVVVWNGTALTTTFVSGNQLTAEVSSSNIATADTAVVYVYTPANSGQNVVTGTSVTANSNQCNAPGSNSISFTVSP